ncbi:nucleoside-diphosphate-sugar epimerase [Xanthomonas arboricola]|jgi:nucleoside-diphosphate-sugar epimerase|uniref:NAD-dependent epimerase/dehydratase family protein n=1 Tax=Xanthomonas arboricola TaxID=56448 RepID=UPI00160D88D4|nr:NAD(P)-dependent oxidoreductase [Xanthomonas arboricola]MBB6337933.1 nucleoside-diphosphate-sugar epimerase [Xanthomonas arboricola]
MSDKKRIAVTGAHGKVGDTVVPHLQQAGYEVFCIDQDLQRSLKEHYIQADLTDFGQALDALSSIGEDIYARAEPKAFDAIVHLASMPHPRMLTDSEEFRVNMLATYNVFESARRLGIKNVVWTSSEVGTGVPYDKTGAPYVPVDEHYPMRGYNVYSLTKVLGEEMAHQFCLNDPEMRITCLRLSNVINPEEYADFNGWQDDPTKRLWNMWTYIDVRDAAQAIERAIEYDVRGKDAFFITNDETVMRTPSSELLNAYYPDVERRKAFEGNEVILSNKKAKEMLGFKPTHRWTDEV